MTIDEYFPYIYFRYSILTMSEITNQVLGADQTVLKIKSDVLARSRTGRKWNLRKQDFKVVILLAMIQKILKETKAELKKNEHLLKILLAEGNIISDSSRKGMDLQILKIKRVYESAKFYSQLRKEILLYLKQQKQNRAKLQNLQVRLHPQENKWIKNPRIQRLNGRNKENILGIEGKQEKRLNRMQIFHKLKTSKPRAQLDQYYKRSLSKTLIISNNNSNHTLKEWIELFLYSLATSDGLLKNCFGEDEEKNRQYIRFLNRSKESQTKEKEEKEQIDEGGDIKSTLINILAKFEVLRTILQEQKPIYGKTNRNFFDMNDSKEKIKKQTLSKLKQSRVSYSSEYLVDLQIKFHEEATKIFKQFTEVLSSINSNKPVRFKIADLCEVMPELRFQLVYLQKQVESKANWQRQQSIKKRKENKQLQENIQNPSEEQTDKSKFLQQKWRQFYFKKFVGRKTFGGSSAFNAKKNANNTTSQF